jgi:hypothetical protein
MLEYQQLVEEEEGLRNSVIITHYNEEDELRAMINKYKQDLETEFAEQRYKKQQEYDTQLATFKEAEQAKVTRGTSSLKTVDLEQLESELMKQQAIRQRFNEE